MKLHPKLLEVTQTNTGVHPDAHPKLNFLWKTGSNVRFTNTGVRKDYGWSVLEQVAVSLGSYPLGAEALVYGNTEELHIGNNKKLMWWDGGSVTEAASIYSGDTEFWSFAQWGEWMFAAKGGLATQVYKGTTYASSSGWGSFVPAILVVDHNHLLGFNVGSAGNKFVWSDVDNPEVTTPATTNAAGDLTIREFGADIVAAKRLGDTIAVYGGGKKVAIVRYVGAPFYFAYDVTIENGMSVFNKACVVSANGRNYGVGSEGFFETDGITQTEIGNGSVKDTFFDEFTGITSYIFGYHNSETNEIVWFYPTSTSSNFRPNRAISYNYVTQTFSFKSAEKYYVVEAKTESNTSLFRKPLSVGGSEDTANYTFDILRENDGLNAGSQPLETILQSKPMVFATDDGSLEDYEKIVEAIKLYMGRKYSVDILKVRIGVQDSLDDDIYYYDVLQVEDPTVPVFPDATGRWVTLRLESREYDADWELQGFSLHGKLVGGNPK